MILKILDLITVSIPPYLVAAIELGKLQTVNIIIILILISR